MADMDRPLLRNARLVARSRLINIDNGAGTTIDEAFMYHSRAIRLLKAFVLYTTETAGTVAAATVQIGTTVGGSDVVAATAYGNGATVGTVTALVLAKNEIPANTMISVRHTGVAATALGEAYIVLEYAVHE